MTFQGTWSGQGLEDYYKRFIELQERLQKSEEERLQLEMKFNGMIQATQEEEQLYFKRLKTQYKQFMEENRKRQERNEKILLMLERIESRAAIFESKSKRLKLLRNQYYSFLNRVEKERNFRIKETANDDQITTATTLGEIIDQELPKAIGGMQIREKRHTYDGLGNADQLLSRFKQQSNEESIADEIMQSIYERNKRRNNNLSYGRSHVKVEDDTDDSTTEEVNKSFVESRNGSLPNGKVLHNYELEEQTEKGNTKKHLSEISQDLKENKEIVNENGNTEQFVKSEDVLSNGLSEIQNVIVANVENHLHEDATQNKMAASITQEDLTQVKNENQNFKENEQNNYEDLSINLQNNQLEEKPIELIQENAQNNNENKILEEIDNTIEPNKGNEEKQLPEIETNEQQEVYEPESNQCDTQSQLQQQQPEEQQQQSEEPQQQQSEEPQQQQEETQNQKQFNQEQYDENNQPIYNNNIEYDESGQPIQYDANGAQIYYDENGQQMHYDQNTEQYEYTNQQYDENGQPIDYNNQEDGYTQNYENYQYDENGQIINYPQQDGYYDENGQVVYDQNLEPEEKQNTNGDNQNQENNENLNEIVNEANQNIESNQNQELEQVSEVIDSVLQETDVGQDDSHKANVLELLNTESESTVNQQAANESDFDFSSTSEIKN